MARTNDLKTLVEPYVRTWLTKRYGIPLEPMELPLTLVTGGIHKFDVVSEDRTIVGGIKTSAVRSTGKVGVGTIKSAFTELYFLSLVDAEKKLLVLTDPGFFRIFTAAAAGKLLPNTEI